MEKKFNYWYLRFWIFRTLLLSWVCFLVKTPPRAAFKIASVFIKKCNCLNVLSIDRVSSPVWFDIRFTNSQIIENFVQKSLHGMALELAMLYPWRASKTLALTEVNSIFHARRGDSTWSKGCVQLPIASLVAGLHRNLRLQLKVPGVGYTRSKKADDIFDL